MEQSSKFSTFPWYDKFIKNKTCYCLRSCDILEILKDIFFELHCYSLHSKEKYILQFQKSSEIVLNTRYDPLGQTHNLATSDNY